MYASIGFVGGLFFECISLLGFGFAGGMRDSDVPAWLGTAFGMAAIVVFPIIYGVLGLIGGALTAALYNLFSATVAASSSIGNRARADADASIACR